MPEPATPPAFAAAIELFDGGRYLAAHELLEELWEETEGAEANFYKGLIQAAIALHHFREGNLEGAARPRRNADRAPRQSPIHAPSLQKWCQTALNRENQ